MSSLPSNSHNHNNHDVPRSQGGGMNSLMADFGFIDIHCLVSVAGIMCQRSCRRSCTNGIPWPLYVLLR